MGLLVVAEPLNLGYVSLLPLSREFLSCCFKKFNLNKSLKMLRLLLLLALPSSLRAETFLSHGKASVAGSGALGYGAMGLTAFYGDPVTDDAAMEVLKRSWDGGCRHFDTAEVYKTGVPFEDSDDDIYNERVVGKFLKTVPRDSFTIATKFETVSSASSCVKS